MPPFVEEYGDAAATVACAWYDRLRAGELGDADGVDGFHAGLDGMPDFPTQAIQDTIRWRAGLLWDAPGRPADRDALAVFLHGAIDRWVRNRGQEALRVNAARDPRCKRWALVPQGKTCAFCTMEAGRGFRFTRDDWHPHAGCDCQLVPSFTKTARASVIQGYDIDTYERIYTDAEDEMERIGALPRHGVGSDDAMAESVIDGMERWWRENGRRGTFAEQLERRGFAGLDGKARQEARLAVMRRQSPADLTDGVNKDRNDPGMFTQAEWDGYRSTLAERYIAQSSRGGSMPPATPAHVPSSWGSPRGVSLSERRLAHILYGDRYARDDYGGGHMHGYEWVSTQERSTSYPNDWGVGKICEAITDVIEDNDGAAHADGSTVYNGWHNGVKLHVVVRDGSVVTAYPTKVRGNAGQ